MVKQADNIIGLYDRHAAEFDRQRGRSLFERSWLDRFLSTIPAGGKILDLGCGMAEPIARYIIERGFHVTGVDSSPNMIELCIARFPEQAWIIADMRQISVDRRFDGILAWDSFFHLTPDDQRLMFPVFAAQAWPGAALMFTSGPRFGEAVGTFEGEPLYHASLDPDDYRSLLAANGFEILAYTAEDDTCAGHSVWLAKLRVGG
jgi:SAM-dependent methyltransferase